MEKLEKLAAETKFTVYSRRATLAVTAAAAVLVAAALSLFAAGECVCVRQVCVYNYSPQVSACVCDRCACTTIRHR